MKLDVLKINGGKAGKTVDLPKDIFGVEPNDHIIYLAVKHHQAKQRQGTHKTKERNEVAGSTKKIKRQKGTGTARAGDIKNPLFRGGGRIFGPEPRDYGFKFNKKERTLARKSAWSYKAKDGNILVVEDFTMAEPKTKDMMNNLTALEVANNKVLLLMGEVDTNTSLSARNIPNVLPGRANDVSIYDLLNSEKVILTESGLKAVISTFENEKVTA